MIQPRIWAGRVMEWSIEIPITLDRCQCIIAQPGIRQGGHLSHPYQFPVRLLRGFSDSVVSDRGMTAMSRSGHHSWTMRPAVSCPSDMKTFPSPELKM